MTERSDVVRQVGPVLVDRTKHPDGTTWYAAWEPAGSRRYGEARTIDGAAYGRVDTRQHPKPLELPSDPAGCVAAITSWELAQREKAYEMIGRAFPETAEGFRSRGRRSRAAATKKNDTARLTIQRPRCITNP